MPATSMIRFIARMMSHGSCSVFFANSANATGSCSKVMIQPIALDAMMTSSTTPVASPDSSTAALTRCTVRSR